MKAMCYKGTVFWCGRERLRFALFLRLSADLNPDLLAFDAAAVPRSVEG